jgi:hypothetical protein
MEDELENGLENEPELEQPEIEEPELEVEDDDSDLTFFGLNFGIQPETPAAQATPKQASNQLDAIVDAYAGSKVMQDIVHYRAEGYDDKTILEALFKIHLETDGQPAQEDEEPLPPKVQKELQRMQNELAAMKNQQVEKSTTDKNSQIIIEKMSQAGVEASTGNIDVLSRAYDDLYGEQVRERVKLGLPVLPMTEKMVARLLISAFPDAAKTKIPGTKQTAASKMNKQAGIPNVLKTIAAQEVTTKEKDVDWEKMTPAEARRENQKRIDNLF